VNVLTFVALTASGVGILLAHPRFYWGETGYFNTPAAFELPLAVSFNHNGWGRNVHFLAAWIAVLNGLAYVVWGLYARHFRSNFVPRNPPEPHGYNLLQRLAYSGVVFGLMPLLILSGLTMSPGITAAFPQLFTLFGGRQSARTIHFFLADALLLFVVIHVVMVCATGFRRNIMAMVTGEKK
jgi:thiosulfate reductase cytochrome b subunit